MIKLQLFKSRAEEQQLLENSIKSKAGNGLPRRILEAGCGRKWPLRLDGVDYSLTGVDFDKTALGVRKEKVGDLNEAIHGDLRYVSLSNESFDVIYNSFVLEHVEDAERILRNFTAWLKPGGILLLRIPDRYSVYGFVTRVTPLWFHVAYKKYLEGNKNAGRPGFDPYPTFHEPIVSREGIHSYCQDNGMAILEEYGQGSYLDGGGFVAPMKRIFVMTVSALSLGTLQWRHNNLTYVIRKL